MGKEDTERHQGGFDPKCGDPQRRSVRVKEESAAVAKHEASAEVPPGRVGAYGVGQEEKPDEKSKDMGHREGV